MQMLASKVDEFITRASWIRKMFEQGIELKTKYGADAVCDFSLGNPDLPPPPQVKQGLLELAENADKPFAFGYMPNAGYPEVRSALAEYLGKEQATKVDSGDVIITCGAAGALNALFKAVLEPCDKVVCPTPFFVEYVFYTDNHGGEFVPVRSKPGTFELDMTAMEEAIDEKTRVVLINSPNNPSGVIYSEGQLKELISLLNAKTKEYGRPIYLISDEPYRFLVYDGATVPPLLSAYEYAVVIGSFSKSLSLAGERVGYAAVCPSMPNKEQLLGGLIFANRILGYVNAPAIGQLLAAKALNTPVDLDVYAARRKAMAEVLDAAGYNYTMPNGAFYFFPEAPGGDDTAFVQALLEEKILAVPGKGFGFPGYFRLTFCVGEDVIKRSAEGFAKAKAKFA